MSKKSTPKIPGGYILKARIIWDKDIARKPPYFREMWDWCLMKASHASYTYSGKRIERGEFLATYEDMKEDLHWLVGYRKEGYKKWQYEKFTRAATIAGMIAATRTTRGLFIKVLNYDLYQDPKNYESGDDSSHERKDDILDMSADIQGINNEVNELQGINNNTSQAPEEPEEPEVQEPKFSEESEAYRLSVLLFEKIKELDPKAKMPDFQKWADHMDKLIRIDGRTFEEIEALIFWIFQDSFWSKNILSSKKLREKFSQLWINAKTTYSKSKPSYSVIS